MRESAAPSEKGVEIGVFESALTAVVYGEELVLQQNSDHPRPENTSINVENSSDVFIGPVTQIHGPVTIYQGLPGSGNETRGPLDEGAKEGLCHADLVTDGRAKTTFEPGNQPQPPPATGTEATPTKKVLSAITNKHSTILLILTAAILVTATLSIIFALNPSHRPREDGQSVTSKPPTDHPNFVGEHRIYTKSEWGGRAHTKPLRPLDLPAEYVLISHTAGQFCENFNECAPKVQFIQSLHVSKGSPDIGYNFLIGGDGSVYTGRGWDFTNFHNAKSVGVSLLGNYVYDSLNEDMLDALQSLLERGVALGKLPVDYKLVCHNQTTSTLSPGDNAYKEIAKFSHFYKGPVVI